jgi:M6 family metalloprotease-like protein
MLRALVAVIAFLLAASPAAAATIENDFVSSRGWVKPGETYPFTVKVTGPVTNATVTLAPPDGTTISGSATWDVGTLAAGATARKVFEARADTLAADPEIVWKNLSSLATLTYDGGSASARSHGPKVIPPDGGYDTARYGDRPFPVVPVDYADRTMSDTAAATKLESKINDPSNPGSTFNLYQEMSYGQLFPHATVPSAGVASRDWTYGPGFQFTTNALKPDTCRGVSIPIRPAQRIKDGRYQLPGTTDYYGDDGKGSALIGALSGVGALQDIDSACGPTGKSVFDAAQIADPEIDYDAYDTDKDGVVDFFMMVFPGLGGNGDSQLNGGYDNIWPHSADLQNAYVDANGQKGYVSDDQSHDLEGRALFWTDATRTQRTTSTTPYPVYVRVGPYNVNPETAIEHASVISHEYGHSLGLPDYYSTGSRETYGSWTLMATDYSQNIDIVGKKELGWVVPRVLESGQTRAVAGWQDTKRNTHRIDWKRPDGTPYTLQGDGVDNGEAYAATLPGRQILDPALVPSGSHVQWSGSGNDFGCPPSGGHNLDLALPAVPAGTQKLTLSFKSRWDVEWDFDYGFVLGSADNGKSYHSYASANGYTTAATQNPNAAGCQQQFGNGITGSSGSYKAGTQTVDRLLGNYPDAPFVDDGYDISDLIGKPGAVIRFAYATDPGLARPGWFIDDVVVKADDTVIYSSDFEQATDPAPFNGGCREGLATAQSCTHGWTYVAADAESPAEHAYLLELRDRSGFDAHGQAESDRGDITFSPGVLLAYTDEDHGYGNVGTDDPPAQTPLDARPEPGSDTPNLDDAAFKAGDAFDDADHVDNYTDGDGNWVFNYGCLKFDVTRLAGAGIGPEVFGRYDLDADATFTASAACGRFDYGNGAVGPGVPTAPPQAFPSQERKPAAAAPGASAAPTKAVACATRNVRARGPLSAIRLACRTLTFRLRRGSRVRVEQLRGKKVVKLSLKRAGRTYTVKAPASATKLRLRSGRTTLTLTLPR